MWYEKGAPNGRPFPVLEGVVVDASIEERFVTRFVRSKRRERLLFELTTPKRRSRGLDRFCHQAQDILDPAKIRMVGENLDQREEFKAFVGAHDDTCCVLTGDASIDGATLRLSDAVRAARMACDAVIIVGTDFAVVVTEATRGGRDMYLLTTKDLGALKAMG